MTKSSTTALMSLISLVLVAATPACGTRTSAAPPMVPEGETSSSEMALLGIGPGTGENQITPDPNAGARAESALEKAAAEGPEASPKKEEGSDIVPPFPAAGTKDGKSATKGGKGAAKGDAAKTPKPGKKASRASAKKKS